MEELLEYVLSGPVNFVIDAVLGVGDLAVELWSHCIR
jgi:hypothetical protein